MASPFSPTPEDASRPIDALLAGYVVGALEPHMHALVTAHLMLSDENRGFVRALEAEAGAALDRIDAPLPQRVPRDHVLSAIYAGGYYGTGRPAQHDPELPSPLYRLVGKRLDQLPWKRKLPGLKECKIFDRDGVEAIFYHISAGRRMPKHTHAGSEATLVLRGAFHDERDVYRRGDVSLADGYVEHRPTTTPDEDCVCFAVTDAPLKMTGPVWGVLQRLFGK